MSRWVSLRVLVALLALLIGCQAPAPAEPMGIRIGGGFSGGAPVKKSVAAVAWTPASLTFSPQYLFDLKVAGSITADGSNNVTALADARTNYQSSSSPAGRVMSGVGSGLVAPVLHSDVSVDGTPGLLFTHSLSTHMLAAGTGAAPGSAPFALFSVATEPAQTLTDYAALSWLGTATAGPPFPGNVVLATMADGSFFVGGYGSGGGRGYGAAEGRDQSQPTTAAARLVVFDGSTLRSWVNGVQQSEWIGTSYGITTDDFHLGGTFGLGQGPNQYQHYGFFQWSPSGTLSFAEVMLLNGWVTVRFPSMLLAPQYIGMGCSLEAGANSGASPQINGSYVTLALAAAHATWTNFSTPLFGRGIVNVSDGNGTALYGDGVQTVASPDHQSAFQWTRAWRISLQARTNLVGVGTAATNDMYFGSTAAQVFEGQRAICAMVAARGGVNHVSTVTPRSDSGVAGTFAAQRLLYNAMVRALWNVPLEQGGLGAKYLLDVAADSRLSDETNATYFNGDRVHWLVAGQAVAAGTSVTGAAGCPAYGPAGLIGNVGLLGILNAEASH